MDWVNFTHRMAVVRSFGPSNLPLRGRCRTLPRGRGKYCHLGVGAGRCPGVGENTMMECCHCLQTECCENAAAEKGSGTGWCDAVLCRVQGQRIVRTACLCRRLAHARLRNGGGRDRCTRWARVQAHFSNCARPHRGRTAQHGWHNADASDEMQPSRAGRECFINASTLQWIVTHARLRLSPFLHCQRSTRSLRRLERAAGGGGAVWGVQNVLRLCHRPACRWPRLRPAIS